MGRREHPIRRFYATSQTDGKESCRFCHAEVVKMPERLVNHIAGCVEAPSEVRAEAAAQREGYAARKRARSVASSQESSPDGFQLPVYSNARDRSASPLPGSMQRYVDSMTADAQGTMDRALARMVYTCALPLSLVEQAGFREFMRAARPSYSIPTRAALSNVLLEQEYVATKDAVYIRLRDAPAVTLSFDGWTNINRDAIINVMACAPEPFMVAAVEAGPNRQTSQYLHELMERVVVEMDREGVNVVALSSDNASNMASARESVAQKHGLLQFGCMAHWLNLLLRDVLDNDHRDIKNAMANAGQVSKVFRNNHIAAAALKAHKQVTQSKAPALVQPCQTRWGTHISCLESLIANRDDLTHVAVDRGVGISDEITSLLVNREFWNTIKAMVTMLMPLYQLLRLADSDIATMADVVHGWFGMYKITKEAPIEKGPVYEVLQELILTHMKKRRFRILLPTALLAYDLHPLYRGERIDWFQGKSFATLVRKKEQALSLLPQKLRSNHPQWEQMLHAAFGNFRLKLPKYKLSDSLMWPPAKNTADFVPQTADLLDPISWWNENGSFDRTLKKIALTLFSLPLGSSANERNFSAFGYILNARRNRLGNDKATKLVFLYFNGRKVTPTRGPQAEPITTQTPQEHASEGRMQDAPLSEAEAEEVSEGEWYRWEDTERNAEASAEENEHPAFTTDSTSAYMENQLHCRDEDMESNKRSENELDSGKEEEGDI